MVEFFKFDRLLAAGSRGCFTPGSVYGARCRHSGRPRWLPRSRSGHAVPLSPPVRMCCKGKSGLKEGGAVFERITARREREYFSRENAQASCCQGCPPPRAPEERGLLLSQGGVNLVRKRCVQGPSCAWPFGGGAVCWAPGWVQV